LAGVQGKNGNRKTEKPGKEKFPVYLGTPVTQEMLDTVQRLADRRTEGNRAQLVRFVLGEYIAREATSSNTSRPPA